MKNKLNLILFLFLTIAHYSWGQESEKFYMNYELYGDISDGMPEKDSIITLYNEIGSIIGIGKMAVENSTLSNLKIGHWKEYYSKGNINCEGTYKLGAYIQCCFSGPCFQYYYYRDGFWKYYDKNGELKYELEFKPNRLHIETSCEGGDNITFGLIKEIPLKYIGEISADLIFEKQKIIISESSGITTMTPLNGELHFSYKHSR